MEHALSATHPASEPAPDSGADQLVGAVLDARYRITGRVARGGMATVYTAVDGRLGRTVAVKVMHAAYAADQRFLDRFTLEARAIARLSHPHVVAVYDQGSHDGIAFLVMEYVPGTTLRDVLADRGRLTPAEALDVMEPVLEALASAHRAGLVHRDVKPENVLVGTDGAVKVADFGLARAAEASGHTATRGVLMGTVAYVAPEQVTAGLADPRTDVYSAGIMLYEMLTGTPPFTGDSAVNVVFRHVSEDVPPPSARVGAVTAELDGLVQRATRREPGARPADAGAFLAELRDVRADLGLPREAFGTAAYHPPSHETSAMPVPFAELLSDSRGSHSAEVGLRTGTVGRHHSDDTLPRASRVSRTSTVSRAATVSRAVPATGRAVPVPGGRRHRRAEPADDHRPAGPPARAGRRGSVSPALLVTALFLVLGLVAAGTGWWLGAGRYVTAPPVVGLPGAQAEAVLTGLELRPAYGPEVFDETVPAGAVVRQDPPADGRLPRDSEVTLVLSKGPERYPVPADLVGAARADAEQALTAVNLRPAVQQAANDDVEAGRVVSVDPPPGTPLMRNAEVTVVISTGPAPVEVDDVVGEELGRARERLEGDGFRVEERRENDDGVPRDRVISQDPAGGEAAAGSTVTLVVSDGPREAEVPDVDGRTVDEARQLLEAAGFSVDVVRFGGGDRVQRSVPDKGSRLAPGSRVTIVVF